MKIQDFKILADENLHKVIVAWLRDENIDFAPRFILTAENKNDAVRIRLRQLGG